MRKIFDRKYDCMCWEDNEQGFMPIFRSLEELEEERTRMMNKEEVAIKEKEKEEKMLENGNTVEKVERLDMGMLHSRGVYFAKCQDCGGEITIRDNAYIVNDGQSFLLTCTECAKLELNGSGYYRCDYGRKRAKLSCIKCGFWFEVYYPHCGAYPLYCSQCAESM